MGQKKIKRAKTGGEQIVDPNLDEVDEDRAFEIELDEETKEVVMVHHYRRKWGDELEGDVEHILTIQEAGELVAALVGAIDELQHLMITERDAKLVEIAKPTPTAFEGNPLQGPNNRDGK